MQTEQSGPFLSEQTSPSDSLLSPKESSGRRFFLRKAPQKHKSPPQAKPPPLHGAAGGSQPQASLDGSLVREDRMELAAALLQAGEKLARGKDGACTEPCCTLLQAHERGRQSRVEVARMSLAVEVGESAASLDGAVCVGRSAASGSDAACSAVS